MAESGLHVGEGVPVGYCDGVKAAVVAAGAPRPILLGDQVQRDGQGKYERRIIPAFSKARNSSFSGSNRRGGRTLGRRYLCRCDVRHRGAACEGRRWDAAATEIPRAVVVPVVGERRRRLWSRGSRG